MANLSNIEDMPNITANFTDEVYEHDETPYERIFLELFTLVGLCSVISNILMTFVILKYKKMREDTTNLIFLQVNILQAIYLFATPLTLRVAMAFFYVSQVHVAVFCVSYQIESTLMFAITWFLFLLLLDWYLKLYCKDTYVRFSRSYKFFVIGLYVLVVFVCSVTIQYCFRSMMVMITYLVMLACVALLVIFLFVLNIIHAVKKRRVLINQRRGNIGLAIANICFLAWSPTLLLVLIISVTGIYLNVPILVIVLVSLGFSSPVFNLIYLYFYDDNYNVFLKQVFRCKCNEYKNESLDNRSVSYNDVDGVRIPEN